MNSVKGVFLCFYANMRKQLMNPRFYITLAIVMVFHYYSFECIPELCEYLDLAVTPWVFPFFLGNLNYFFIFGGLAMLMYCDAPFMGADAPMLIIRLGRKKWILGQLLYIYLSALIYTLFNVLMSILMIFPEMAFSAEWGDLLWNVAQNPWIYAEVGITGGFYPVCDVMERFTPVQAMGLSILLFYLGTVFIGMLILCFRFWFGNMLGIVISGVFTSIAYFAPFLGLLNYGYTIYYLSPISWSCLNYLVTGEGPSPLFAVMAYLLCVVVMSIVSMIAFCKKDISWEEA